MRLASGYVDRVGDREPEATDDREERIKALEESYKKEEISKETFEQLRFEIAGGDLESTHLVKGLDFKLLQRVRRGEDVYGEKRAGQNQGDDSEGNVDEEFDQFEQQDVEAIVRDTTEKKKRGQLSTVSLAPGKKRTRDQILAELKASRQAAKAQQEPALGDRFRKIGAKQEVGPRIEIDSKGREVLIIVDEDGHEKKKVRKVQHGQGDAEKRELLMPKKDAAPLGMEVPEQYRNRNEPEEDDDDDIFGGVGDDYDPLAGVEASDSDSGEDEDQEKKKATYSPPAGGNMGEVSGPAADTDIPPPSKQTAATRNYFKDSRTGLVSEESAIAPSMSDATIMAAIKKAASLNPISTEDDEDGDDGKAQRERKAQEERRKRLLESANRDDEDLDMGFGTSRFEDEADFEDNKAKLSVWGEDEEPSGHGSRAGKSTRKRGPKKHRGDGNNAADVLRVMAQRNK